MVRRGLTMMTLGLVVGCNTIFGIDELSYVPGTGNGQGGATSAGGGLSSGGTGGTAATTGGAGGVGGLGGQGGATGRCGDGVLAPGEQCDDANDVAGDGCDGCLVECEAPAVLEPQSLHCYLAVLDVEDDWNVAQQQCQDWGGDLAVVTSPQEQAFLAGLSLPVVWLGGSDQMMEGTFTWVTGEPFVYDNWDAGEPNDAANEDCIEMFVSGAWNDEVCGLKNNYVCERWPPVAGP